MPTSRITLLFIILATIVIRTAMVWVGFESLKDEYDDYGRLAVVWSESGTFGFENADLTVRPTAYRPPLYPWLLSWLVVDGVLNRTLIAMLHVVLGSITVAFTYLIAKCLGLRVPWLPAMAVALDPVLLRGSQLVMTETLAACLAVGLWYLWLIGETQKFELRGASWFPSWFVFGAIFGLATLARPTAFAWLALLGLFCAMRWVSRRKREPQSAQMMKWLLASLAIFAATMAPWTLRNWSVFGKPIWATTHGGYTLLLANNPRLYDHFREQGLSRRWNADPFHRAWAERNPPATKSDATQNAQLAPSDREFWYSPASEVTEGPLPSGPKVAIDEVTDNRLAYEAAWATIASAPGEFVRSCLYRASWFWAAWPYSPTTSKTSFLIGFWYIAWFVLAVVGLIRLWRLRRQESTKLHRWLPALTLLLALTLVHSVFWGNMRMRGQMMPALVIVATLALGSETEKANPRENVRSSSKQLRKSRGQRS